jgi:2-dehydro-3-deoxyphosphogluconate aldolase/(4S)-4-hydroxy-2-oxoglutarate aldolase
VTATAAPTLERLRTAEAIAVIRARDADEAVALSEALHAGGLRAIELTFTTRGVEQALRAVRDRLGDSLLLGAGTITTPEQVNAAAESGADFLVSPHLDPALLETMLASGLLSLPGVLTPSEIALALRTGVEVVKLFPASSLGVDYMTALFGPFPGLQVVPTGGISVAGASAWLDAGAAAVGLGSELLPKALREAHAWDEISRNAARLLSGLSDGR